MAMQVNRKVPVRRARFVFEADAAYEAVVEALCDRYMVSMSELLRRLLVDEARRNGMDVTRAPAAAPEDEGGDVEEELEAA